MLLAGYVLMSELVWFVPVSIFYGYIVYHIVVAHEEHHLLEKYGEPYAEYLERVPRWMPNISFHHTGARPEGETSRVRTFLLPSLRGGVSMPCDSPDPSGKGVAGSFHFHPLTAMFPQLSHE